MQFNKFSFTALLTLGLCACSTNQPVKVVSGDSNVDYSRNQFIHISESQTLAKQPTVTLTSEQKKPADATALCNNGTYSTESESPCSNAGGVKEKFKHYRAE